MKNKDRSIKKRLNKDIAYTVVKIARKFNPEKIFLFGSWAWGEPNEDSDVDLLVIKDTDNTRELARKIDKTLFPRLFPIDLLVFNPKDIEQKKKIQDTFILDILTKGKLLYER